MRQSSRISGEQPGTAADIPGKRCASWHCRRHSGKAASNLVLPQIFRESGVHPGTVADDSGRETI